MTQPTQDPKSEIPTDTTVACSDCNTNTHIWLTCPNRYPTSATKPLDEQIEVIVSIACGAELGLLDDEYVDEDIKRMNAAIRANKDRLRKPIKALIANQVREAKLNELEDFRNEWHTMIRQEVFQDLNDRIKELENL